MGDKHVKIMSVESIKNLGQLRSIGMIVIRVIKLERIDL